VTILPVIELRCTTMGVCFIVSLLGKRVNGEPLTSPARVHSTRPGALACRILSETGISSAHFGLDLSAGMGEDAGSSVTSQPQPIVLLGNYPPQVVTQTRLQPCLRHIVVPN
jgi:hypothetical protein